MDELLSEISAFARAHQLPEASVVKNAQCGNGSTWRRWSEGKTTPTMKIVDRLRGYMRENPAPGCENKADAA